ARQIEDRVHRLRHERRRVGPRERLLPDGRRHGHRGEAVRADLHRARAGERLLARRADRLRPLREDGPQRHRVRPAASVRRRLRDLARVQDVPQARPHGDRQRVAAWERRAVVAQRARGVGVRARRVAGRSQRLGRRLGRGAVDGAGSNRPRRAGAGDHAVAADAIPLAAGRFLRREGDRGAAERVRRPRGEAHMTAPAAGATVSARPTASAAPRGARDRADPCTMVIFGAQGDLSRRKLLPAIYQLMKEHLVDERFCVLGVGRDESVSDDSFRAAMRTALGESDEVDGVDDALWEDLCRRLHYVAADLTNADDYTVVGRRLEEIEHGRPREECNRLFYLAVPPSVFEPIVRNLSRSGLAPRSRTADERPWTRIVIEKPFGRSLENAQQLNDLVLGLFAEHQTYRIDHYLGKETVQNVLVLRFANSIFEPLWNRQWIHHVQITASESVGIEGRGKYYEEAGVVRDMFQNHLLQLLSLTAM